MLTPRYYIGQVVANDDSVALDKAKLSRIKVRIIPEFEGVTDNDLPWIRPFTGSTTQEFSVPNIGDTVIVITLDEFFKTMFYYHIVPMDFQRNVSGTITYDSTVKPKLDALQSSGHVYPNVHVQRYPDGTIYFRNDKYGDTGIIHNTGTTVYISSDGKVTIKDKDGKSLKKQLTDIHTVLGHIILGTNWVGNLGAPLVYKQAASDTTVLQNIADSIAALYKE